MAAYIAQGAINGKSGPNQTPLAAAMHNLRAIAAELRGRPGDRIDPRRSHLNRVLHGPSRAEDVAALIERLITEAGARIIRKDQIRLFEVVIALKQEIEDQAGFFEAAMHWMHAAFACPLVSAVVHLDEDEPHMHLLFVPLRDGRLQGDAVMGRKADVLKRAKTFQAEIGTRYGLEEKRAFTARERAAGAKVVIEKIMRGRPSGWLSANELHQLDKAIAHAGDFEALMLAFGVVADSTTPAEQETKPTMVNAAPATPIGVQTTSATSPIGVQVPAATPIGVQNQPAPADPYQCVGVALSAVAELHSLYSSRADWEDIHEHFEERAAIAEYECGMRRIEAERTALQLVKSWISRKGLHHGQEARQRR